MYRIIPQSRPSGATLCVTVSVSPRRRIDGINTNCTGEIFFAQKTIAGISGANVICPYNPIPNSAVGTGFIPVQKRKYNVRILGEV